MNPFVSSIGHTRLHDNPPSLRPVICDEWHSYSEVKPTKEDGYKSEGRVLGYDGLVTAIFEDGSVGNHGWDSTAPLNGATHWRRITPPQQPKPKSVKFVLRSTVGAALRDIEIMPDGTGKLDCGDVISSKSIDEFIKARNAITQK